MNFRTREDWAAEAARYLASEGVEGRAAAAVVRLLSCLHARIAELERRAAAAEKVAARFGFRL